MVNRRKWLPALVLLVAAGVGVNLMMPPKPSSPSMTRQSSTPTVSVTPWSILPTPAVARENFRLLYKGMPDEEVVKILGPSFGPELYSSGFSTTIWDTDDAYVMIGFLRRKVHDGSFESKDGKATEKLGEKPK